MALDRLAAWQHQRLMCGWLEAALRCVVGCAEPVTAGVEPPAAWPSTSGRAAARPTTSVYYVPMTVNAGELIGGALRAEDMIHIMLRRVACQQLKCSFRCCMSCRPCSCWQTGCSNAAGFRGLQVWRRAAKG